MGLHSLTLTNSLPAIRWYLLKKTEEKNKETILHDLAESLCCWQALPPGWSRCWGAWGVSCPSCQTVRRTWRRSCRLSMTSYDTWVTASNRWGAWERDLGALSTDIWKVWVVVGVSIVRSQPSHSWWKGVIYNHQRGDIRKTLYQPIYIIAFCNDPSWLGVSRWTWRWTTKRSRWIKACLQPELLSPSTFTRGSVSRVSSKNSKYWLSGNCSWHKDQTASTHVIIWMIYCILIVMSFFWSIVFK